MILSSLPQQAGRFSLKKLRLSYGSNHYDERPCSRRSYSFIAKKDMLVIITDGTLYTTVNGVEYAETKGIFRLLKPGDKVSFTTYKAVSKKFQEYAEFILISI